MVDLSHAYDDETIFWPTGKPFRHERTAWGLADGGYWYSSYDFASSEHSGTHLDAPIHFAAGKQTVGEIPLEKLAGPAFVIDIAARCARDPDYAATAADFASFEAAHGAIPQEAIVLVRTGWSSRWPDVKSYMGDDTPGKADNLHFPGLSPDAARRLAARKIGAVGIDTASLDPGTSTDFRTHRILAAAGIPGLENVANLDALPGDRSGRYGPADENRQRLRRSLPHRRPGSEVLSGSSGRGNEGPLRVAAAACSRRWKAASSAARTTDLLPGRPKREFPWRRRAKMSRPSNARPAPAPNAKPRPRDRASPGV